MLLLYRHREAQRSPQRRVNIMTIIEVLEYRLKAQKIRLSYLKSLGFSGEQLDDQLMSIRKTQEEINNYYDDLFI